MAVRTTRGGSPSAPPAAPEDRAPVVEARDLVKKYAGSELSRPALAGVSIRVEQGRFVSIMGPSGSGKSTLLHMLGALDAPTSGEVFLDGRPLSGMSDDELTLLRRHHVGFVFQFFNLVPVLTASENVALPAVIDGHRDAVASDKVAALLDLVGLSGLGDRLPAQLSGGQQQRVAIARALVNDPVVLLADEPTGNLDSANGQEVLAVLQRAREDLGMTIILVSHDPTVAAAGDQVVALRDGSVAGVLDLDTRRRRRTAGITRWLVDLEREAADATP